jgi:hypothetical protein
MALSLFAMICTNFGPQTDLVNFWMTLPSKIVIVNRKAARAAQVRSLLDDVTIGIIDSFIFEAVVDFCRQEWGYPEAPPLCEITQRYPIVPPARLSLPCRQFPVEPAIPCPSCREPVPTETFSGHLCACMKNHPASALVRVLDYFQETPQLVEDRSSTPDPESLM